MAEPLPKLRVDGARLLDPSGQPVVLRGVNLGNWLLLEPWMMGLRGDYPDQYTIVQTLAERFGRGEAERLLDLYRANYITPRELEIVRSFGFNVVRLPFDHELLAWEDNPHELRPDAFEWLDRGIELAEAAGIYVILDMHGAPGRQSHDMPSGRVNQNALWDGEEYKQRTEWLWKKIAERYRDRAAVVAYDLLNEPWHDFKTDHRPQLAALMDRLVAAVRSVDREKLIFAAGALQGIAFYGHPKDRGWTNVGFTDHFYPGLFGQGAPTVETHARFISRFLPLQRKLVASRECPYLVGEFNVVFDTAGQADLMRQYYDTYAEYGWHATMWCTRIIVPEGGPRDNNWYLLCNAEPFTLPDFRTASAAEIEQAFRALGTQKLGVDEELRECLTAKTPRALLAPPAAATVESAPQGDVAGWSASTINCETPGGAIQRTPGELTVYGVGQDVWGSRDNVVLVHQAATGDFGRRAWLTAFDPAARYAKAGWMLRAGIEPDAPHAFVHAFGDGRVMMCWRETPGGPTQERVLALPGQPCGVGLERTGDALVAWYAAADGQWQRADFPAIAALASDGRIGLAVNSNHAVALTPATFRMVEAGDTWNPVIASGENLLRNGSFETRGDADDRAAAWERWGAWINREAGWTPVRDGTSVLGYHHFRIESSDNSAVYQDVTGLQSGERYEFSVWANVDLPAAGKTPVQAVELLIEAPYRGRTLKIASQSYSAAALSSGSAWSRLSVAGDIPADGARVLLIVTPAADGPRDGALKFDLASFTRVAPSRTR